MYSQLHSELSAVRPSMKLAIGHGVPIFIALAALSMLKLPIDPVHTIWLVFALLAFVVLIGGVQIEEVVHHRRRFAFVAASATVKALGVSILFFVLGLLLRGGANWWRDALAFAALYVCGTVFFSLVLTRASLLPRVRARPWRVAIVGVTETSLSFARTLREDPFVSAEFVGFFEDRRQDRLPAELDEPLLGNIAQMRQCLDALQVEEVFIALTAADDRRMEEILEGLLDTAVSVHYLRDFEAFKPINECVSSVSGISVYTVIGRPDIGVSGALKRGFDVVCSGLALLALSPLLLLVALAIRLESPGPALFRQLRYGADGRPFSIYKFRSMTTTACAATDVVQATRGDARVTRLGRLLRKSSVDELPQLLNILLGDMSLVGPRPHAVPHNEHYRGLIRGYMLRHKVRPGLTGWAQIHGLRGETETVEKMAKRVEFDLDYMRQWSLALDVYIVFCTFGQVFKGA